MSEAVQVALIGAALNAAVTWGIVSTKLAWLRADLDRLEQQLQNRSAHERPTQAG